MPALPRQYGVSAFGGSRCKVVEEPTKQDAPSEGSIEPERVLSCSPCDSPEDGFVSPPPETACSAERSTLSLQTATTESLEGSAKEVIIIPVAKSVEARPVAEVFMGRRLLDRSVKNCTVCDAKFGCLTRRRHYCRKCGGIICSSCGDKKLRLCSGGELVRVCRHCAVPKVSLLVKADLLRKVFSYLPSPDLAAAFGAATLFYQPRHLPYRFEEIQDIQDDYGPELKYLERGSFASVFSTTERSTGRKVAVKCMQKSRVKNVGDFSRLHREVELHMQCNHPNIVKVLRVVHTAYHLYVVMEVAEGDLFSWLSNNKASEDVNLRIGHQLLSALTYLHEERGIVHRDVKLENLLVFPPAAGSVVPTVKLCDFGFARSAPVVEAGTMIGVTPCGTSLYFPPEVLRAVVDGAKKSKVVRVDGCHLKQMDVFSAGILLHFLLRRREAFRGGVPAQALRNIEAGLSWPEGHGTSDPSRELLESMLVIDPATRLTSRQALDRIANILSLPPADAAGSC